ncbi:FAD/NAD(P)-binding domain-containing protein [Lophium mytilinum]|uniref:FAD/NAD(P)-binding domain-containing protein n=1 Tax=Lophium mytilinum TaxID=390894 RepID=A0A6A6QJG5_9PEZI|nr:FAD/NAD(P)-binding domain-containing protein [Lophium mytilinum]
MHVLISGAGIAGPTLAWFLAKTGTRVTLVEKSPSLLPNGQNVDIQGSALTIIQKMGLWEQVRRFNTTEKGTKFINPTGQPFASFPITEGPGKSVSLTSDCEILRADLAAILHDATKDHPNVKYLFGTTIKDVVSNGDDSVRVELSNGAVQEFDLLVAADGQWSKVRKQCFPPESVKVLHKGNYVAYWTVPRLPKDNDWWNVYLALPSRFISIRPDPHGTIRALFSLMPCNSGQEKIWMEASKGDRQMQEALLRREFGNAGWQAKRLLNAMDQAPDFYFHEIAQVKMSKWFSSRVVCLGDAAYAPTPLTGMGTTLAIIGAYVLAGELSKLGDGEHPSRALEGYESVFRPLVDEMQQIPFFFPAIAHPETAWKRWLIQALVWAFSKVLAFPWLATKLGNEGNRENFSLPEYSSSDSKGTK